MSAEPSIRFQIEPIDPHEVQLRIIAKTAFYEALAWGTTHPPHDSPERKRAENELYDKFYRLFAGYEKWLRDENQSLLEQLIEINSRTAATDFMHVLRKTP